jgi:hypothetical protein
MCCSFQYCASASATWGRSAMPTRSSSASVAVTIGCKFEKSPGLLVISAASTICPPSATGWAFYPARFHCWLSSAGCRDRSPRPAPVQTRAADRRLTRPPALRTPGERTRPDPPACATAQAAHPRAPRHITHPRPHRSPSPPPRSPARSPQRRKSTHDSRSPPLVQPRAIRISRLCRRLPLGAARCSGLRARPRQDSNLRPTA